MADHPQRFKRLLITDDASNKNDLRIHDEQGQICKVYGWTPEDARANAEAIVAGLKLLREQDLTITSGPKLLQEQDLAIYPLPGESDEDYQRRASGT